MKWLWPRGLVARVAIVMAVALFAIQAISVTLHLRDQARAATTVFQSFNAERMVNLVATLEPLTRSQRSGLLAGINSPTLQVALRETGPEGPGMEGDSGLTLLLRKGLQQPVTAVPADALDATLPDPFASQQKVAYWVRLADGQWVRFVSPSHLPSLGWILHMSALLGLVSLLLIAFVAWAVHRLTRPIRAFASAAERLGTEVDAPVMDDVGGPELQVAGDAFNTMARRLQRYVGDRTRMLAAISHDLRTSLTRLRLRLQFIEDQEQATKAEQDVEEMEAMLDTTLAFARDDADREPMSRVDLATLLLTLCHDLSDQGHVVRFDGPESMVLSCRPVALRRALSNLLTNAVLHGGGADVRLSEGDDHLRVQIQDPGPGIPEHELDRVFEPFVRLDESRSKTTGGSGLGLAIARSAIHSHGGRLTLTNGPEGGVVATVQLPR